MAAYQSVQKVQFPIDAVQRQGAFALPEQTRSLLVFACGNGSRRFLIVSLVALLTLVLVACSSAGGPGPTPTPTPTSGGGYGTAHGCPSDAVVMPALPAANVTVKLSDANTPISARVGETIEIQLPFGLRWTGPTISGGGLSLQTSAGYASPAIGMCLWRFNAVSAGTTRLTFSARALCVKGQFCPLYVLAVSFTIVVK